MFWIEIAELIVQINNHYSLVKEQCRGFLVEARQADMVIEVDDTTLQEAVLKAPQFSHAYQESILIYAKMNQELIIHQAFVLHGAVIDISGHGYAFLAPSGTGKTTQVRLWRKVYGEKCRVINGDKPIIRIREGKVYAYGTPWCGKEGWTLNDSTELKAVLFLEQGAENATFDMESGEVIDAIFQQVIIPQEGNRVSELLRLLEVFMARVRTGKFICNRSIDAVGIASQYFEGE